MHNSGFQNKQLPELASHTGKACLVRLATCTNSWSLTIYVTVHLCHMALLLAQKLAARTHIPVILECQGVCWGVSKALLDTIAPLMLLERLDHHF